MSCILRRQEKLSSMLLLTSAKGSATCGTSIPAKCPNWLKGSMVCVREKNHSKVSQIAGPGSRTHLPMISSLFPRHVTSTSTNQRVHRTRYPMQCSGKHLNFNKIMILKIIYKKKYGSLPPLKQSYTPPIYTVIRRR